LNSNNLVQQYDENEFKKVGDSIFKRISQKNMDREDKMKLMYSSPKN
jgi:hypothetical protein